MPDLEQPEEPTLDPRRHLEGVVFTLEPISGLGSAFYSRRWALVTELDLGLELWSGIGQRPGQGWHALAETVEGGSLLLVPGPRISAILAGTPPFPFAAYDIDRRLPCPIASPVPTAGEPST